LRPISSHRQTRRGLPFFRRNMAAEQKDTILASGRPCSPARVTMEYEHVEAEDGLKCTLLCLFRRHCSPSRQSPPAMMMMKARQTNQLMFFYLELFDVVPRLSSSALTRANLSRSRQTLSSDASTAMTFLDDVHSRDSDDGHSNVTSTTGASSTASGGADHHLERTLTLTGNLLQYQFLLH
jgi:hypothetical protein